MAVSKHRAASRHSPGGTHTERERERERERRLTGTAVAVAAVRRAVRRRGLWTLTTHRRGCRSRCNVGAAAPSVLLALSMRRRLRVPRRRAPARRLSVLAVVVIVLNVARHTRIRVYVGATRPRRPVPRLNGRDYG
jgi:hypothetical protein